jgi:hypothetical protein|nr:MAG TPA: Nucleotide modification associated domain 1 [Caudoviricetes sp.]
MDKGLRYTKIVNEMYEIYKAKNADYGDSVHDTFLKYGLLSFLVRMEDKISRLRSLTLKGKKEQRVKNESILDTLQDLANYAILAIIELEEQADTKNSEGIE